MALDRVSVGNETKKITFSYFEFKRFEKKKRFFQVDRAFHKTFSFFIWLDVLDLC